MPDAAHGEASPPVLTAAPVVAADALSRPLKGAQDWLVPPLFRAAEDGRAGGGVLVHAAPGGGRPDARPAVPALALVRTPRDA